MSSPGPSCGKIEFFKVYLPDQSSQHIRVPPAYVKLLNGAIPNKAILKDLTGKFWPVEMEEAENGVFLKDGWKRFASYHSLVMGNFLVFTYHGDSSFDVKIFGTNGCMKEEVLGDKCINEGPSTVEKINIHLKAEKESQTCPMLSHSCKRKYAEVAMKRYEKSNGSSEESRRRSLRFASQTVEQLRDTSEFSLLKNPYFIASVRQSSQFNLRFPRKFLAETGIKMDPEVSLRNDNGKLWPISIYRERDGRAKFGKGWGDFRNHHKLSVPTQRCAFEFLLRGGRRECREIAVHIPRPEGKYTPKDTGLRGRQL